MQLNRYALLRSGYVTSLLLVTVARPMNPNQRYHWHQNSAFLMDNELAAVVSGGSSTDASASSSRSAYPFSNQYYANPGTPPNTAQYSIGGLNYPPAMNTRQALTENEPAGSQGSTYFSDQSQDVIIRSFVTRFQELVQEGGRKDGPPHINDIHKDDRFKHVLAYFKPGNQLASGNTGNQKGHVGLLSKNTGVKWEDIAESGLQSLLVAIRDQHALRLCRENYQEDAILKRQNQMFEWLSKLCFTPSGSLPITGPAYPPKTHCKNEFGVYQEKIITYIMAKWIYDPIVLANELITEFTKENPRFN